MTHVWRRPVRLETYRGGKAMRHVGKEKPVEREDGEPVEPTEDSLRSEGGGLSELVAFDPKFEPSFAGEFHFGKEE